ncbi:Sir2 family transcriptional regulator [Paraburkholderia fungorum]|uniref:SIR2 family NAD-dependent protein deacylase n=1 Tax=Paraburkholderia TaxID=1822464 RepID=UPI0038B93C57
MTDLRDGKLEKAAGWLRDADGLLITAGAGMGVDSGLPDFRGRDGFSRAYPALRHRGLSFEDMANPAMFAEHPKLAWGFYGHRLKLYRDTVPHEGFAILRRWADRMSHRAFVFTSNVDGQLQKAGFPEHRVHECHGSIHTLQCLGTCTDDTWSAIGFHPLVNETTSELESPMPRCPRCGALARPNILMFGDWAWVGLPYEKQQQRLAAWISSVSKLVVVEVGAGKALPTVRRFSERFSAQRLIRINLRESDTKPSHRVGLEGTADATLKMLDAQL